MTAMSVRFPESLHAQLQELAKQEGVSINQLVVLSVAEKLAALKTEDYFRERAARADHAGFLAVLCWTKLQTCPRCPVTNCPERRQPWPAPRQGYRKVERPSAPVQEPTGADSKNPDFIARRSSPEFAVNRILTASSTLRWPCAPRPGLSLKSQGSAKMGYDECAASRRNGAATDRCHGPGQRRRCRTEAGE